ncbi:unnamed protein product [Lactuca saligna]|uniref:AB hydrolase-1 domain-containing protein n=1 Tax=Lactuca saligna TaxID=75948 RepID=A0AA35ZBC4_LACSI|nr:unnamed protein product [Lactuca saligna]
MSTKHTISPAAARSHTRKSKPDSSSIILNKFLLVIFAGFFAWAYQTALPPPPKTVGSPDGPPITSPRIKLRDGRHLSYIESGVSKDTAKYKLIFIHGFNLNKYYHPFEATASPALVEELGVYFVAIDRPGYGESDPDPKRTVKSLAFDIEEVADHLNLGRKFYVAGYSMGGQIMWSCLKYIPHRLAGAVLIAPGINYWWPNLPSNLTNEAFSGQLPQDQWALRVAHHLPWLSYWWNSQKWFPSFSFIDEVHAALSSSDITVASKFFASMDPDQLQAWNKQPRQQGEFESLHRDLNIGFGKWDFDPIDLKNPFPNNEGSVHIWQGDEDLIVPVTLQRYIAHQLTWVKYHELTGTGHLLPFADGVIDSILRELLTKKN